jgi:hypothetical protein
MRAPEGKNVQLNAYDDLAAYNCQTLLEDKRNRSTRFDRFVMKHEELPRIQGKRSVSSSFIIRELDLEDIWVQRLDNRTYVSPVETALGQIFGQGNHFQNIYRVIHLYSKRDITLRVSSIYTSCHQNNVTAVRVARVRLDRQAGEDLISVSLVQPDGSLVLAEDFEAKCLATGFGGKRMGGFEEPGSEAEATVFGVRC